MDSNLFGQHWKQLHPDTPVATFKSYPAATLHGMLSESPQTFKVMLTERKKVRIGPVYSGPCQEKCNAHDLENNTTCAMLCIMPKGSQRVGLDKCINVQVKMFDLVDSNLKRQAAAGADTASVLGNDLSAIKMLVHQSAKEEQQSTLKKAGRPKGKISRKQGMQPVPSFELEQAQLAEIDDYNSIVPAQGRVCALSDIFMWQGCRLMLQSFV